MLLLVVAGVAAGLVGSIAGLASVVSYPALLAAGLAPLSANVTNSVAMVLSTVGSVSASRPELRTCARLAVRLAAVAALGGAAGCALLLCVPASGFEAAAPWLIGASSLAVLARPGAGRRAPAVPARLVTFLVGVYGGYFGAAAGVMMLAALSPIFPTLAVANAVKNLTVGAANAVAAVAFAVAAPVRWPLAAALAAGLLIGGAMGPRVVRRAHPRPLRMIIALVGLAVAVAIGLRS